MNLSTQSLRPSHRTGIDTRLSEADLNPEYQQYKLLKAAGKLTIPPPLDISTPMPTPPSLAGASSFGSPESQAS